MVGALVLVIHLSSWFSVVAVSDVAPGFGADDAVCLLSYDVALEVPREEAAAPVPRAAHSRNSKHQAHYQNHHNNSPLPHKESSAANLVAVKKVRANESVRLQQTSPFDIPAPSDVLRTEARNITSEFTHSAIPAPQGLPIRFVQTFANQRELAERDSSHEKVRTNTETKPGLPPLLVPKYVVQNVTIPHFVKTRKPVTKHESALYRLHRKRQLAAQKQYDEEKVALRKIQTKLNDFEYGAHSSLQGTPEGSDTTAGNDTTGGNETEEEDYGKPKIFLQWLNNGWAYGYQCESTYSMAFDDVFPDLATAQDECKKLCLNSAECQYAFLTEKYKCYLSRLMTCAESPTWNKNATLYAKEKDQTLGGCPDPICGLMRPYLCNFMTAVQIPAPEFCIPPTPAPTPQPTTYLAWLKWWNFIMSPNVTGSDKMVVRPDLVGMPTPAPADESRLRTKLLPRLARVPDAKPSAPKKNIEADRDLEDDDFLFW